MIIERPQLEERLNRLRQQVESPKAGLFGPSSLMWRYSGDSAVFVAGGRAALMQLAHPYVATAIAQHSSAVQNPLGRFQRTFEQVFRMVFGTLEEAFQAARTVHTVHTRIYGELDEAAPPYPKGHRYAANERQALRWVRATLLHSSVVAYRCFAKGPPLQELDALYRESLKFAALFGLRPEHLSPDWHGFDEYVQRTSRGLTVTQAACEMGQQLLQPPALQPAPLAYWYRVWTTGLLPECLREGFALPFGKRERALFRASKRALPWAHRALPRRLLRTPGYADALRRLNGGQGRDPLAALMERLVTRVALGSEG